MKFDVEVISNHRPEDITRGVLEFTLERLIRKNSSPQNRLDCEDGQQLLQQLGEVLLCWQQLGLVQCHVGVQAEKYKDVRCEGSGVSKEEASETEAGLDECLNT